MKQINVPPTPFPTQAEILLVIVNAFNIQKDRKKLYEYVRHGDTLGFDTRDNIIDKIIYPTLANGICSELAKYVQVFLKQALDDYLRVIMDKDSDFSYVQRQYALPYLAQAIGSMGLFRFFSDKSLSQDEKSLLLILNENETLFESIVKQLRNDTDWQNCYDSLKKEDKDKILSWKQGKGLPSLQSIRLLFNKPEFKKFKRFFLLARMIEFFRKSEVGRIVLDVAIYELKGEQYLQYPDPRSYAPDLSAIEAKKRKVLENLFNPEKVKDKNRLRDEINKLSQSIFEQGLEVYGLFELCMAEAQWHVLAGKNKKALEYYKQAFNHALYRVGNQQESIIKRGLCVAAMEKDIPFLKRLKNQAIVFGIYNPPFQQDSLDIKVNNKRSRSRSNTVEDWEIQQWRSEFGRLFPKEMFFDGCECIEEPTPIGMTTSKMNKIEPDYRHLNRNITIPVLGRMKKEPQLVWFIFDRNYEVVKKLLDKGASVDVCSDTGDTPLLASVIQMSKNKLDSVGESDDRFFMLLSKYKHKSETVNQRTSKKRLTPLMSAIDAGRVDVVQKLLDMGAEVDRKASADDMTPLYYCIQLIKRLETPDEFKYKLKEASKNPEINKELRRWGVNHLPNSPLIEGFIGDLIDNVTPLSEVDPKEIEKIALLLLENGANPNCEHNITGSNSTLYTPLMLAAEEDNAFLFEKMLDFGGDIQKRAKYSTRTPSDDDIEGICKYFSSKKVIRLLRQRKESSS